MKNLIAVICAAGLAACAHANAAPEGQMTQWQADYPFAAEQLCMWSSNHPTEAQRLVQWEHDHPVQAQELIQWASTHPNNGSVGAFMQSHPGWGPDTLAGDPVLNVLAQWAASNPGAVADLQNTPGGIEWATSNGNC